MHMEECVSLQKIGTHADRIPVGWSFLRSAGGFDTAGAKLSLLYITGLHFFNLGEKEPIADNEHVAFPKYRREPINSERLRQQLIERKDLRKRAETTQQRTILSLSGLHCLTLFCLKDDDNSLHLTKRIKCVTSAPTG